jgi:hypothetical protein
LKALCSTIHQIILIAFTHHHTIVCLNNIVILAECWVHMLSFLLQVFINTKQELLELLILEELHSFTLFSDRVLSMVTHYLLAINNLLVKEGSIFIWLNKIITKI